MKITSLYMVMAVFFFSTIISFGQIMPPMDTTYTDYDSLLDDASIAEPIDNYYDSSYSNYDSLYYDSLYGGLDTIYNSYYDSIFGINDMPIKEPIYDYSDTLYSYYDTLYYGEDDSVLNDSDYVLISETIDNYYDSLYYDSLYTYCDILYYEVCVFPYDDDHFYDSLLDEDEMVATEPIGDSLFIDMDSSEVIFDLYPNPSGGKVNILIDAANDLDYKLDLLDTRGKILVTKRLSNTVKWRYL